MPDMLDYILLKQENAILKLRALQDSYIKLEEDYRELDKEYLDKDEELHLILNKLEDNQC